MKNCLQKTSAISILKKVFVLFSLKNLKWQKFLQNPFLKNFCHFQFFSNCNPRLSSWKFNREIDFKSLINNYPRLLDSLKQIIV